MSTLNFDVPIAEAIPVHHDCAAGWLPSRILCLPLSKKMQRVELRVRTLKWLELEERMIWILQCWAVPSGTLNPLVLL